MFDISPQYFPNVGWLEIKLSPESLNFLKECINNKKKSFNKGLAGNIEKSYLIKDKNNWFFKTVLLPCIEKYIKEFTSDSIPNVLTKDCEYILSKFWVNYQKKTQFNPLHNHSGVFSFVIWINIPSSFEKEAQVKFIKHSNLPSASLFQFHYTNSLGQMKSMDYRLDSNYEGTMLFFPAKLPHQVYPFYTSNKTRVSVSGNICLNPDKPL